MKTSLDSAGRIHLPEFVQVQLGVKPGDELALEEQNGKWLIKLADANADDLNWEELEYIPPPLKRATQVSVQFMLRGKLQPMAHDLDDE